MQNVWCGVWVPTRQGTNGQPEPIGYIEVKWRDLNYKELQQVRSGQAHPRLVYTRIYELCLVDGPVLDDIPAGIVAWIGKQQIEQNPFNGRFETISVALEAARQGMTWRSTAQAVIAGTFRYPLEEIDNWSPRVFFERLAMAELLTGVPINPANPVEADKGKGPNRAKPTRKPKSQMVPESSGSFTRRR